MIDKKGILHKVSRIPRVELELGCGNRKRREQSIGVDVLDEEDVDIVGDVYEVLALFPPRSVDAVYGYHFVEHLVDLPKLILELERIVKPDGYVEFVAPHFSNPYFYSDPTHLRFFGLYTFCYFGDGSPFRRRVPTYGYKSDFRIVRVDLVFKSAKPFIFRYGIKYLIGKMFNSCSYLKELYEENFCYLFPCYEVRYVLKRK